MSVSYKTIRTAGWVVLTVFFWLVFFKGAPGEFVDLGGDSSQYIIIAESLSKGIGPRMVNFPGGPFGFYYPPIFPLLLSPVLYFFGRNFFLMHVVTAALGFASLFLSYRILKKYTGKNSAFLTVVLLCVSFPFLIYSSGYVLSDIPYMFFSLCAFYTALRYRRAPSPICGAGFLLIGCLLLAYFTRYIGLTLCLGVSIYFLLNGKDLRAGGKAGFFTGGFFIIAGSWEILKKIFAGDTPVHLSQMFVIDPYAPSRGNLFSHPVYIPVRFMEGVNYYYDMLGRIFFPALGYTYPFLKESLSAVALCLLLFGLWRVSRLSKDCVFHYYFMLYFLLIIFWPFRTEDIRFLVPILPFIFFYFVSGAQGLYEKRRVFAAGYYTVVSAVFVCNLAFLPWFFVPNLSASLPVYRNFLIMHSWVRSRIPQSNAVFISRKPTVTYFYSAHRALAYPFDPVPEKIRKFCEDNKAGYIIADEFSGETRRYLLPFIQKYQGELELLHSIGNTKLFALKKGDGVGSSYQRNTLICYNSR
ncbi:MAG: glycosyltransferase family 39 protein, partial [Candidatus Omnitrophota bacterium]